MPNSAEHREKADRNRAFLGTIDCATAPEWAAVVAFYTALHLVERLSACDGIHHGKHQDRLNYLCKKKEHRRIHANFLALYDASMIARYATANRFTVAYPGDVVQKELVDKHLTAVADHVRNHFAASP